MKRGIDFEKMEAAFKRAAYKAIHGTREERSGRFFLPEKYTRAAVCTATRVEKIKIKAPQRLIASAFGAAGH